MAIQSQASTSQARQSNVGDHLPRKRSMVNEKSNSLVVSECDTLFYTFWNILSINRCLKNFRLGKLIDDEDMIKSLLCLIEISLQKLNDAKWDFFFFFFEILLIVFSFILFSIFRKQLESVKQQQIEQIGALANKAFDQQNTSKWKLFCFYDFFLLNSKFYKYE